MEDTVRTFMTLNVNFARWCNRLVRICLVFTASVTFLVTNAAGKEWRGITPLKSSRVEVQSLLGKPDELGFYKIDNEQAIVFYSDGPCEDRNKCECAVPKDTVLRVNVTLNNSMKLSAIDLGSGKYTKKKAPYGSQATYSDLESGVVYTVDESDRTITAIDYWPSAAHCQEILTRVSANRPQNVWHGLIPLHSKREEVERLLGSPKDSIGQTYIYETQRERVDVSYSEGKCENPPAGRWNVPAGTALRIKVYPRTTILLRDLPFDVSNYRRSPDPNIRDRFFYINDEDGVMIESELDHGCERVVSVTYQPTAKDATLRCPTNSRVESKKP
jgi:hypothetical protein